MSGAITLPKRAAIRARTTEVLASIEAFGGHVFNARSAVLRRDLLPAARIYIDRDQRLSPMNAFQSLNLFEGSSILTVQIVIEDSADPRLANLIDSYCAVVEQMLMADRQWSQMVTAVDGLETEITLDDQGEYRTATATIEIACRYSDCVPVEFTDDLKTARIQYDFIDPPADPNVTGHPTEPPDGYPGGYPGPDGRIEVEQEITFDQEE